MSILCLFLVSFFVTGLPAAHETLIFETENSEQCSEKKEDLAVVQDHQAELNQKDDDIFHTIKEHENSVSETEHSEQCAEKKKEDSAVVQDNQAGSDQKDDDVFSTIKGSENAEELLKLVKDTEFKTPDEYEPWEVTVMLKSWGIALLYKLHAFNDWIFSKKRE